MTDLPDFLNNDSVSAAKELIGWRLFFKENDGSLVGGTIVETEAYNQDDAASHSFKGKTPRTKIMFGPAGYLYVYFTYGMHWCMNIVTGPNGRGEAVLIRAIVPEEGVEIMRERRNYQSDHLLTNGPAKVCQALAITGKHNGLELNKNSVILKPPKNKKHYSIQATERVGISKDTHRLWRFVAEV